MPALHSQSSYLSSQTAAAENGALLCIEEVPTSLHPDACQKCSFAECEPRKLQELYDAYLAEHSSGSKSSNVEASPKGDACQVHDFAKCESCKLQKYKDALLVLNSLPSSGPKDPMFEGLGFTQCGSGYTGTASLSLDSTKYSYMRAKKAGFEIVSKDDAVEEEAEEVVTVDKAEEDYVEVLLL